MKDDFLYEMVNVRLTVAAHPAAPVVRKTVACRRRPSARVVTKDNNNLNDSLKILCKHSIYIIYYQFGFGGWVRCFVALDFYASPTPPAPAPTPLRVFWGVEEGKEDKEVIRNRSVRFGSVRATRKVLFLFAVAADRSWTK